MKGVGNSFDAIVAVNTPSGEIACTAAHEVGHSMGLPHVFDTYVDGPDVPLLTPIDTDLIPNDNPLAGNLMMHGPFPERLRGSSILESQVLHILNDNNGGKGKLNREDIGGADTKWGDLNTDKPVYKFQHLKLINSQLLIKKK